MHNHKTTKGRQSMKYFTNIKKEHDKHIIKLLYKDEIIQRYNNRYNLDILNEMSYYKLLQKFSWSELFIKINATSLYKNKALQDSTILALEMFGLSIRIFDDVIDSDGPLRDSLSSEACQFLSMELLIKSFCLLSENDFISFDSLQRALSSQFYDHIYQEKYTISTVDDYFDKIIGKSTYVFIFYFSLLFPGSDDWREIASSLGTISQIKNDLRDIFSKNSKKWKNNSLPYILLNSITDNKSLTSIKNTKKPLTKSEIKILQRIFIESGGFEYCIQIIDKEKQAFEKRLQTMLSKEQREPFTSYLERIRFFDL